MLDDVGPVLEYVGPKMLNNWTSSVGRTCNVGLMMLHKLCWVMLDQQLCPTFDEKYAVRPTTLDDVVCATVPDGVGPSILDQLLLVEPV